MFLTDGVEVFVVKGNRQNDFATECVAAKEPMSGRHTYYMPVADGEEYSVAVLFGKTFEISPASINQQLDRKVSACRVRVTIDKGIALEERVFKLPDLEARPCLQEFSVFFSASNTKSGSIRRYRPQFAEVAKEKLLGQEMPKDLRNRLGRIDVELERGYIDYGSKADTTAVFTVPGASTSKWFAPQKHGSLYRTQLQRHKKPEKRPICNGRFVSGEPAKSMRILYLDKVMIRKMHRKGRIITRPETSSWGAALRAMENYREEKTIAGAPKIIQRARHDSLQASSLVSEDAVPASPREAAPSPSSVDAMIVAELAKAKKRKGDEIPSSIGTKKSKTAHGTSPKAIDQTIKPCNNVDQAPRSARKELSGQQSILKNPTASSKSVKIKKEQADKPLLFKTPSKPAKKVSKIDLTALPSDSEESSDDESRAADEAAASAKSEKSDQQILIDCNKLAKTKSPSFDVRRNQAQHDRLTPSQKVRVAMDASMRARAQSEGANKIVSSTMPKTMLSTIKSSPSRTLAEPSANTAAKSASTVAIKSPKRTHEPQASTPSPHASASRTSDHAKSLPTPPSTASAKLSGATERVNNNGSSGGNQFQRGRPDASVEQLLALKLRQSSEGRIKMRSAKLCYEILQAEEKGKEGEEEAARKKIEMRECQIELARREIQVLRAKLGQTTEVV